MRVPTTSPARPEMAVKISLFQTPRKTTWTISRAVIRPMATIVRATAKKKEEQPDFQFPLFEVSL